MHELSIVEALIDQVGHELDRSGQEGKVLRVELSIGRLSGVNADSVRFAFGLLAPGTRVEDAEIVVREPKAVCRCHACNARVEIDDLVIGTFGRGIWQTALVTAGTALTQATANPSSLDFGAQIYGTTSASQIIRRFCPGSMMRDQRSPPPRHVRLM